MAEHNKLGLYGENKAVEYLIAQGYRVLDRNWRYRHFELDIIIEDHDFVAVVEVKTRSTGKYIDPAEAVDYQKIRHIVSASNAYIYQHKIQKPVRFDIVTIISNQAEGDIIKHYKDAFWPPITTF